jgi:thiamine biosynthesis lipoprotein
MRDKVAKVVVANDLAIATSGAYARGDHVLDPHTGQPPRGVLSVTITGPDLATADAYATAAFAMGLRGPAWTARLRDYEAMTILADGRVLSTPGFPGA